jgi:predicted protein tyrosine phosphatase
MAENIFSDYNNLIVASAGPDYDAEIKVNADYVYGSDMIFVMEKDHEEMLKKNFESFLEA